MAGPHIASALERLREYRQLAPWSLRDLAALVAAILDVAHVRPISAAARARPTQRTIRFYVTQGLVTPPEGRGPAATYAYRHLLQVLAIKLRQMEGESLTTIADELSQNTGDVIERRVAALLGPGLPPPDQLALASERAPTRGRTGRLLGPQMAGADRPAGSEKAPPRAWHHLSVEPGVELHLAHDHLLARRGVSDATIALALAHTIATLLDTPTPASGDLTDGAPEHSATARHR
jgi:DNA-binding transcriptional MerR regulator